MIITTPRRGARLVAGASALVAGLALTAVAVAPSVGANTTPVMSAAPVTDGVLDWGIKDSFRDYVEGPIADGEITMTPPATRSADGTFRFPDGTGEVDPDAGTASVTLAGGVYFEGHSGTLQLWIDNPRLEISGGAGVIVADVRSGAGENPGVDLVTFDPAGHSLEPDPDGVVTLAGVEAVLTEAGAPAFGDFYEPGTPMDPFTFTVTVDDGSDPTETPTTTPPTTPPPTSAPPTTTVSPTETPPPPPDPSPSATWGEGEVSSGLLDWGVKESFRSYIAGPIGDGGWTLDGITENDGRFRWTASFGDYDMDAATGSVGFAGGVRFTGHEGSLDITISRPRVRFTDGGAVLVVDVRSKSLEGEEVVEQTSVDFATLDLGSASSDIGDDTVSYAGIPATLTAAGAEGFGGFYEAGEELDPVTIAFAVGGAEVPGGGSAGGPGDGLAGTGGQHVLLFGGVSAALLLLGGGLVTAARRVRTVAR